MINPIAKHLTLLNTTFTVFQLLSSSAYNIFRPVVAYVDRFAVPGDLTTRVTKNEALSCNKYLQHLATQDNLSMTVILYNMGGDISCPFHSDYLVQTMLSHSPAHSFIYAG